MGRGFPAPGECLYGSRVQPRDGASGGGVCFVQMEWKNVYRGVLMGICDLIPGVSGGTVAIMLGIYDRLLEAISGFLGRDWRRHLAFLLPLAVGMVGAMLAFSRVISFVLENYFVPAQFLFLGLVVGVLPMLLRQARAASGLGGWHLLVMVAAAAGLAALAFVRPAGAGAPLTAPAGLQWLGLFGAGWLGSMAMLMPGISGSFVLLLLGVYPTAIAALSNLNIPVIVAIGAGVVVGFIVSSKAIRWLLERYPGMTYAAAIGLIVGSVAIIYPGLPVGAAQWATSVGACGMGVVAAVLLGPRG